MNVYQARKIIKKMQDKPADFDPLALLMGTETPEQAEYTKAIEIEYKALDAIETSLKTCRTDAQVKKAVKAAGWKIIKDNSAEHNGILSLWIADDIRIYKKYPHNYVLQKWQKVKMEYSGIPTFFANPSYF